MKKIVILVLIVLIVPMILVKDTNKNYDYYKSNFPDLPKDENWEYLKSRLFGKSMNLDNKIIDGPVLFGLQHANKQDSLIVNNIIDELKTLLPNKTIDFVSNHSFSFSNSIDYIKKRHPLLKNVIKISFKYENNEQEENDFENTPLASGGGVMVF